MQTIKTLFFSLLDRILLLPLPLLRLFLRLFYRLKVIGNPQELSDRGNILIVANHASFLDPPLLFSLFFSSRLHFLARETLFNVPILGFLIRRYHALPLKRGAADSSTLKMVAQMLKEGKQLVIFPEGTRSLDGALGSFKKGAAVITSLSKGEILPVYIHNSWRAWPKGKWPRLFEKTQVKVFIGKLISWQEFEIEGASSADAYAACTAKIESAIKDLRDICLKEEEEQKETR
jgi:1-acyl-sn-glycerol-3-phosphate acyltransferase